MKPMLYAPETKRLKLNCDKLLSSFAFNVNLRRYAVESVMDSLSYGHLGKDGTGARALPLFSRRDGDEGAHGGVVQLETRVCKHGIRHYCR